MMRPTFALLLLGWLSLSPASMELAAAEPARLDLSAWRHIPVLHHGRLMPLDSFARQAVDIICDRTNPKLGLKDAVPEDELNSEALAEARTLFPAGPSGKPEAGAIRQIEAAELLLSWLAEPDKWEDVPFIVARHDELREKYLGVPVTNEKGEHLSYVSPRQIEEATALHEALAAMRQRRREAMLKEEEFAPTGLDKKLTDLQQAYSLYRSLTFNPAHQVTLPRQEALRIESRLLQKFEGLVQTWSSLSEGLRGLPMLSENGEIDAGQKSLAGIYELVNKPDASAAQIEPHLQQFLESAESLAATMARMRKNLLSDPADEHLAKFDPRQLDQFRSLFRELDDQASKVVKQAQEVRIALYDNGDCLHVVPALNVYALEKNRAREDDAHPWLSLQAVLYGSPELLRDYPQGKLAEVRGNFAKLSQAYAASPTAAEADEFAVAARSLARDLRDLAEAIEPKREKLAIESRDEELIAHTAYPLPGALDIEVSYNHVEPFKWSWIISLGAVFSFALSFGILRKPMFWLGMSLMLGGLVWTAFGFGMRSAITHWAPVTNMYETVVYVPFFVSLLGAWFTLLPLTWPGLRSAWRFSAIPGTWESKELTEEQTKIFDRSAWSVGGFLMLLPRAALMAAVFYALAREPYAAGDRTVINLLPNVGTGESLPDGNDLMTWFVGICVLIPAVWFLPRVAVTAVLALGLVPLSLRGRFAAVMEQVYPRWPFALSATFAAFLGAFTAWWSPVLNENIEPLQPVLRDNFWLLIHVLTIVSSYGAGALAWGLGNIALAYYLFGKYRDPIVHTLAAPGFRPAGGEGDQAEAPHLGRRPPEACATLAGYTYKAVQVAVMLLITGTILGGLWADVSWGRFWGWDPKEVWALISGLVYLAILHGRYAGLFGNFGLAIGSVLGASAIMFSWYGVNFVLGAGLHAYGFGTGGQAEVATVVLLNWAFAAAAALRYYSQTADVVSSEEPTELVDSAQSLGASSEV